MKTERRKIGLTWFKHPVQYFNPDNASFAVDCYSGDDIHEKGRDVMVI